MKQILLVTSSDCIPAFILKPRRHRGFALPGPGGSARTPSGFPRICRSAVRRFVLLLPSMSSEFYQLVANNPQGQPVNLANYKGKTLLIVNTATKCGLAPQFEGLESLYQKYKDKGLVVLGFPCNQFSGQEPEANETMEETCKVNFGVTFPLFEKIDVNGPGVHPVFKFLKSKLGG